MSFYGEKCGVIVHNDVHYAIMARGEELSVGNILARTAIIFSCFAGLNQNASRHIFDPRFTAKLLARRNNTLNNSDFSVPYRLFCSINMLEKRLKIQSE